MSTNLNMLNRNIMRISGLSSGLDTQSMVKDLMRLEQMKVDKQWKTMTQQEWKKEGLKSVTQSFKDIRNKFMTALNPSANIMSAMNFTARKVTTNDTSGAITFSAAGGADLGTRSVKVEQLATAATSMSGPLSGMSAGQAINMNMTLKDLEAKMGGDGFIFGSVSSSNPADPPREFSMAITSGSKTETFVFDETMTVRNMMDKVNKSDVGVSMSYSSLQQSFVLKSDETGSANGFTMELNATAGTAFTSMTTPNITAGQDARIRVYEQGDTTGVVVTNSKNSINLDGVIMQLNATTTDAVSYTVSKNTDSTMKMIKDFVEAYNSMIDSINSKVTEKRSAGYLPLTQEERGALSDKEAEEWEKFARSGMLRNDNTLRTFLSDTRALLYNPVGGTGKTLSSIGITTTSSYSDGGKLQIDENKLRAALEANPEEVAKMFVSDSQATGSNMGYSNKLSKIFNDYTKKIEQYDMDFIDKRIKDFQTRIDRMNKAMVAKEEAYYRKFTAMETMLSKLNSQSASIMNFAGFGQ